MSDLGHILNFGPEHPQKHSTAIPNSCFDACTHTHTYFMVTIRFPYRSKKGYFKLPSAPSVWNIAFAGYSQSRFSTVWLSRLLSDVLRKNRRVSSQGTCISGWFCALLPQASIPRPHVSTRTPTKILHPDSQNTRLNPTHPS